MRDCAQCATWNRGGGKWDRTACRICEYRRQRGPCRELWSPHPHVARSHLGSTSAASAEGRPRCYAVPLPKQNGGSVDLRAVERKRRICSPCGTEEWASDDWPATGMFHFSDRTFVELDLMHRIRKAMGDGTPIETWLMASLDDGMKNPVLLLDSISKDLSGGQRFTCDNPMLRSCGLCGAGSRPSTSDTINPPPVADGMATLVRATPDRSAVHPIERIPRDPHRRHPRRSPSRTRCPLRRHLPCAPPMFRGCVAPSSRRLRTRAWLLKPVNTLLYVQAWPLRVHPQGPRDHWMR